MNLKEFIPKARIQTWTVEKGKQVGRRPSSEGVYIYEEGELKYEDEFFGNGRFQGQEIVYEKGKPIWGMIYYGGIPKDITVNPEEEFNFLRKALTQTAPTARLEGDSNFSESKRTYKSKVLGTIDDFKGEETIIFSGVVTHEVFFAGGVIK